MIDLFLAAAIAAHQPTHDKFREHADLTFTIVDTTTTGVPATRTYTLNPPVSVPFLVHGRGHRNGLYK